MIRTPWLLYFGTGMSTVKMTAKFDFFYCLGHLPRAYVVLKFGYMVSAEDLVQHVNSRVSQFTERLVGGVGKEA